PPMLDQSPLHFHSPLPLFSSYTDPATTPLYTLSLHDALPISPIAAPKALALNALNKPTPTLSMFKYACHKVKLLAAAIIEPASIDRKSTRLNSSHVSISYAVFCLKKKKHKN